VRRVRGEALGPLQERRFRAFIGSHVISLVGDNVIFVALAFAVLDLTHSPSAIGVVLGARVLPAVAFMLAGGVWADRLPRQQVMIASHLVRCASQGATAALLLTGEVSIAALIGLQLVHGVATGFFRPASAGLLPHVVSPERLHQANALFSVSWSVGNILGPALGGALVAIAGAGWAIALDSATFALAAFVLLSLRGLGHAPPPRRGFVHELVEGWHEVASRQWLWVLILYGTLYQFLVIPSMLVLGPVVAQEALGGPAAWGVIASSLGIGSLVGGALAWRVKPRRPLRTAVLLQFPCALSPLALALYAPVPVLVVSEFTTGIAIAFFGVAWETTLQERIPRQVLSRVTSIDLVGSSALRPAGFMLAGPLASLVGIRTLLAGVSGAVVAGAAISLLGSSVRSLTTATYTDWRGRRASEPIEEPA
jgi:MFS family permease